MLWQNEGFSKIIDAGILKSGFANKIGLSLKRMSALALQRREKS
ncbi:hypothetical protein [Sodalis ligni]|nr:hypothetical protein [Sodalis ligni]